MAHKWHATGYKQKRYAANKRRSLQTKMVRSKQKANAANEIGSSSKKAKTAKKKKKSCWMLHGVCCNKQRTKILRGMALNPRQNSKFSFQIWVHIWSFMPAILHQTVTMQHCCFTMRNLNFYFQRAGKRLKGDRPPEELAYANSRERNFAESLAYAGHNAASRT